MKKSRETSVPGVVGEEGPPGLGRRGVPLGAEPGDGPLGHLDPQLLQLAMDSGRAPQGIRRSHSGDQSLDRGTDGRATHGSATGELGPVLAEAAPLPPENGVGGHDYEGLPPLGPDPCQPHPEEAIRPA